MIRAWQQDVIQLFGSSYSYNDKFIYLNVLITKLCFWSQLFDVFLHNNAILKQSLLKRTKIQTLWMHTTVSESSDMELENQSVVIR